MSKRRPYVWQLTQELGKEPILEIGEPLQNLSVNDYLPSIASTLIEMGTYAFKISIETAKLPESEEVSEPDENEEDFDFE